MGKVFVDNPTAAFKMVCGVLIPPFDGREVDEQLLPPREGEEGGAGASEASGEPSLEELRQADPDANLRDLLAASVKVISAGLADHSDETLAGLLRLEQASDTPRKSLMAAITELQLQRAQVKTGAPE